MTSDKKKGTAGPKVPPAEQCDYCFEHYVWVISRQNGGPNHLCESCAVDFAEDFFGEAIE